MGKVVDLVWSLLPADGAPAAPPPAEAAPEPAAAPTGGRPAGRQQLFTELQAFYAEALEYPAEVFTEDVALEADLGVDSVKQTELFARTVEHYGLPSLADGLRLADFDTMGKVVDLVWSLLADAPAAGSPTTLQRSVA
jgi:acyl carrier protein